MYITEVSGHHSATLAIEKALRILSPDAEILNINAFNYTNPISEKIVNRLYMGVIKKAPKVWGYLYDNYAIVKRIEKIKRSIHKFNSPKLKKLFDKFKPNVVICSQAFPCGMVADYKRAYNSEIPLIAVLTDYVPHAYWIYDTVNYYVTPAEEISQRLAKKGVSADKIQSLGIPFDPKFIQKIDKAEAQQKLGLNAGVSTILIMGGGQGLGPIKTIITSLEKIKKELQLLIVCGTNRKLCSSLKRKLKKFKKKTLLFGYTDNINELMDASDIIITKPGGITTAEALAKKIPMVIVKPLPGQEANNTAYLTQNNAAIKVDNPKAINLVIEKLLNNPLRIDDIAQSENKIAKPNASFDIAKLILDQP